MHVPHDNIRDDVVFFFCSNNIHIEGNDPISYIHITYKVLNLKRHLVK